MDALGLIEIKSWSAAMVALDAAEKAAPIRLLQIELNDQPGACIKLTGSAAAVQSAIGAAEAIGRMMRVDCVVHAINAPDPHARIAYEAGPDYSPLIEQDVVFIPARKQESDVSEMPFAIGMIETQGFAAVIEAIDTACKAASVEVIGKEKLGGGYVTVLIKGDVAAVKAAIQAGQTKVKGLGNLIAAHVIPRPSAAVMSLLPKS
jgi:carbon dioxide concentrating mechanism protein CcmO